MTDMIDVLVIGSGPTGLTVAAEALRFGLSVRLVDRKDKRITDQSRALIVHARTIELLRAMGDGRVTDRLLEDGIKVAAGKVHIGNSRDLHTIDFSTLPWGDTEHPYYLSLPQHDVEKTLQKEVELLGGVVEWGKTLLSISQREENDFVESTLSLSDGSQEKIKSRWVIGCDGGRSKTREEAGIKLKRKKQNNLFIIADLKTKNESISRDSISAFLHRGDSCAFFPLPEPHTFRFFAPAPSGFSTETKDLQNNNAIDERFLDDLIVKRTGIEVNCYDSGWTTSFQISYGVASAYRVGGIFLAGDAAHVHSPAGGQGMNFGIQDAMNLVWKLEWAKRLERNDKKLAETILDSYEAERRPLAKAMVKSTKKATRNLMSKSSMGRKISQKFREAAIPYFLKSSFAKQQLSRGWGMLNLKYTEKSPIILEPQSYRPYDRKHRSNRFLCAPGQRLPNIFSINGVRIYDIIDRQKHSWVLVNHDKVSVEDGSNHVALENLTILHAVNPKKNNKRMPKSHAILVRPDLYVASVDVDINGAWNKFLNVLGTDVVTSI